MSPNRIPRHVAIIMDGNGRWAQRRGYPRVYGHVRGTNRVKPLIREADRLGIQALTLYAFSTENWSRPEQELTILWKLLKKYLVRELNELKARNVRFRVIGDPSRLDPEVRSVIAMAENHLRECTGLQLTFAVSYGARAELCQAAERFARDCAAGARRPEEMDEALMGRYLWTAELERLADVDLVIRTSGEVRVSNFLLWQAAYAEFIFTDTCWPEFTTDHLRAAVAAYAGRDRRFGGVDTVAPAASPVAPSPPPVESVFGVRSFA